MDGLGMRILRVAGLAVAMLALAGCELLAPSFGDDEFGQALATYARGHATMTIGGETIELDQLSPGPHLTQGWGVEVYWYNDEGWGLRVSGGGSLSGGLGFDMPATISIDRVRTTYWMASDYEARCDVDVDEMDDKGVRGSASCKGLRWVDVLRRGNGIGSYEEGYVEGEPPFDVTLQFEAFPDPPAA